MDNSLKNKRLLVLGGTLISCEIIKKAKELGCFVAVADYNSVEDSPGKQIADAAFDVSATDVDAVVDLIKKENIGGVLVGFNDMLLPYYAEICEKAGLPAYGTKEQFEIFINKDRYKALMREHNVPTVEEYQVDPDNFEATAKDIKYPVLVKPADSSGARGITICRSAESLKEAVQKAKDFSKTGIVLVERYMEGREATVFWVFSDGEYYLTAIGNRHVKNNQEGVIPLPVGYTYPASVLPKYRSEVEENCKEMFRAAGIKNGMMFMQCKIEDGTCVVYDIGYRLTGSLEYNNIKDACGFDPMEMMIRFALTGKMSEDNIGNAADPEFGGRYGFNVSCLSAPGKIAELTGVEEVKAFPEVIDAVIAHYPGETITEDMKGLLAQITVRVLGTVDSEEQLYDIMRRIEKTIHIVSDDGRELMLAGIEPEDIEGYILR